jgi:hypothetical protein
MAQTLPKACPYFPHYSFFGKPLDRFSDSQAMTGIFLIAGSIATIFFLGLSLSCNTFAMLPRFWAVHPIDGPCKDPKILRNEKLVTCKKHGQPHALIFTKMAL